MLDLNLSQTGEGLVDFRLAELGERRHGPSLVHCPSRELNGVNNQAIRVSGSPRVLLAQGVSPWFVGARAQARNGYDYRRSRFLNHPRAYALG